MRSLQIRGKMRAVPSSVASDRASGNERLSAPVSASARKPIAAQTQSQGKAFRYSIGEIPLHSPCLGPQEPVIQRTTFGKAPRFQKTFTTRTGLQGIILDGDRRREEERARREAIERERQAAEERRRQLKRVPRRVERTDARMDAATGTYGKSVGTAKSHRDRATGAILPASAVAVAAAGVVAPRDHLLGVQPKKGVSPFTSFANPKKARAVRDYTQSTKGVVSADAPVVATLKARKLKNAVLKGKADVRGVDVLTTNDLVRSVRAHPDASRDKPGDAHGGKPGVMSDVTEYYATRDAEVETRGTVPKRFLHYSDDPESGSGSDSDSVSESDTDYSDLEDQE